MKKTVIGFLRRGVSSCGIGPIVLAVLYLILSAAGEIETLTPTEVAAGIFSLSALAFIAGGINVVYQIERLPIMGAILIHGAVLYVAYLITYLLNDWLVWNAVSVIVFSCIFVVGYFAIWAVIYSIIRKNTSKINELMKKKQESEGT